ncbi:leucine-rich repeat-containing serine/threonine-protein kinase [Shewanella basaltis]|uniref:leucine-rich repeat-containing protein kinase family protein n=1 Tax=Shewanella basaltis TaxID=472183 RepID=UPI00200FBD32|nr:leucine-rich repeat-containing protein kinase family protein [Shewanella basaltis]MCL1112477.1 leucine-rich repeat-containing serine/threonine-protein kinase [Shewanella basaltis]
MHTLQQLNDGLLYGQTRVKIAQGLSEFPVKLFELADTLEVLDLTDNQLSSLPDNFADLHQLKILFLSNNQFEHLPDVLGQCPNLDMIGFKANRIKQVSDASIPKQTRWLILTDNQIEQLPDSLGQCYRLEKLALAGNRLTSLPASLANCHQLALIRLSANQLPALPDWLFNLPNLAWLAFSGNPFSHVEHCENTRVPTITSAQYTLGKLLGQGASGLIYQARLIPELLPATLSKFANSHVAIKMFKGMVTSDGYPTDELDCCLAAGEHPHLINVVAQINQPDQLGLVMELIPADYTNLGLPPSLQTCSRDTFTQGTQFTGKRIMQIATQMADILMHLHQNGISHGDIYAHNIMINPQDKVLFGDFGAASNLNQFSQERKQLMQAIEVRAFGCLLDDMLNLIEGNSADQAQRIQAVKLTQLAQDCMQTNVASRPCFNAICQQLASMQ